MFKKVIYFAVFMFFLSACEENDKAVTKLKDGTKVIDSTTLIETKGYCSKTPVEVYVKDGRVVKVQAFPNQETPRYFRKITDQLLPLYEGKSVDEAKALAEDLKVDVCTGATYSARSVQKNIKAALDHYK